MITNQGILFGTSIAGSDTIMSSIKEVTHVYLASRVDYISRGGGIIIYYLKKQYESTLYNALPTPSIDYLVQTKPNIICYNVLPPQTINYMECEQW